MNKELNKYGLNVGHYCLYDGKVVQIITNKRNQDAECIQVGYPDSILRSKFCYLEPLPLKRGLLRLMGCGSFEIAFIHVEYRKAIYIHELQMELYYNPLITGASKRELKRNVKDHD